MSDYPWARLAVNLGISAVAIIALIGLVLLVSLRRRNHSLIDIFWGPGFVLVAVVSYVLSSSSGADGTRRLTVLLATALWGGRLGLYLARRNLGHGEDPRYTALMRHRTGSLIGYLVRKIYGLQGALMFVISLPIQVAMYESRGLGVLGAVGIVLWLFGFGFESIGDWQLSRFKATPTNAGKIMDRGLWAWTRHPNYFGDTCVWVALWVLSLGHPLGVAAVVAPVVMTRLLISITGKRLLDKRMLRSRGTEYELYAARTSGFFPRPPKRRTPSLDAPS
ncbi:DUF1295 domain-containing protein [Leekyejoonella antrihumi]|uniref:DUF1295 domain-containing protein n=1 Tax=Leekyejoonella antrihumi TaxID=1660198 RepID=A0A563E7J1_9MICO|nr:DUF1295 domain-containing protein [Leekyejoonella antrihumi]TWP38500.1 DUF1295 domain-containing protein [Leekyejoonella antrihumi]